MKLLRQELQGHIAAQSSVLSLVDHTHSTTTQLLCDLVVGDGLADHSLVGGHHAFEFFKPVKDDVDLGLLSPLFFYCLDHQEALAVGRDVIV